MQQETLPDLPVIEGVEFRCVPGFYGYCAGDDGTIWSAIVPNKKGRRYSSTWLLKKTWKNVDGYFLCSLRGEDGREHRKLSHTIILLAFVGPRPKGYDCLHANGNPGDNRLVNLRWGTRAENMDDARRHGTIARRERNGHAKLNDLKVKAMKSLREKGWTQRELAILFEVSQPTVQSVVSNKRWKELADAD